MRRDPEPGSNLCAERGTDASAVGRAFGFADCVVRTDAGADTAMLIVVRDQRTSVAFEMHVDDLVRRLPCVHAGSDASPDADANSNVRTHMHRLHRHLVGIDDGRQRHLLSLIHI